MTEGAMTTAVTAVTRARRRATRRAAVLAVAALALAVGCGGDAADGDDGGDGGDGDAADALEARDAWVRLPATGQTVAAAYLTFANRGDTDVLVESVTSPLATAELHESVMEDDEVMRMEHRTEGFTVPAGGELVLEPGGAHVMLVDVDRLDLQLLDETELTFQLGGALDGGELVVVAEIRGDVVDESSGHGSHGGHGEHGEHGEHGSHGEHGDHSHDHDHDHGHDP